MCAIGGIYNSKLIDINWNDIWNLFDQMEERGDHSHGLAMVDANENIIVLKAKGGSQQARAEWQWLESAYPNPLIIMLHTRYATQGSIAHMGNNHPVSHGDILLTHNGCLRNDERVFKKLGVEREHEVDTEAIAAGIHHRGIDWMAENTIGSMSIAWIDETEPTVLNLWTNGGNPLAIGFKPDTKILVYATWERYIDHMVGENTFLADTYTHYRYSGKKLYMKDAGSWLTKRRPRPMAPYTWKRGQIY